jgi:SAM-dependent methyltransferase
LSEYLRCDIGCGHRATGTVNIDPYPQKSIHRMTTDGIYHECKYWMIPNFIQADCLTLPFKDSSFDEVYSGNVIEHVVNPVKMIREMIRVSKDKVTIIVPHRYGRNAKQDGHIHYFNNKWFEQIVTKFPEVYNWSTEQNERGFPFNFIGLIRLPNQITFTMRVNK